MTPFANPATLDEAAIEEGQVLAPRFNADGLVTAVAVDGSGRVLMVAHMDAEALDRTIATGEAHYYSRSRERLWRKGETSGEVQRVVEMRVDCDQDAIMLVVDVQGRGATCHTGRATCFYRRITADGLEDIGEPRLFDPAEVYGS